MKASLTLLLLVLILHCAAQNPPPPPQPVVDSGTAKQDTDKNVIFTKVEIRSEFPGGPASLARFVNKNIRFPVDAKGHPILGTVVVQFIVDQYGRHTDEQAISGPEELRQEAVRVIRLSGLWTPPWTNGHSVKAYKQVPIEFKK